MIEQQTKAMVNLVIDNLHLFGYELISIDEKTITLNYKGQLTSMPAPDFMMLLNAHIGCIKYTLDKITK